MRQVPHFVLIGNGRLSRHMAHYFEHLQLSFSVWSRSSVHSPSLETLLSKASHALILVSDGAIAEVCEPLLANPDLAHVTWVHFSASVSVEGVHRAHPLQSFPNTLFDLKRYGRFPFVIDADGLSFSELLPGVPNTHRRLNKDDFCYYHGLLILANNLSTWLWQKCVREMQARFDLGPEVLAPILEQTFAHIAHNPSDEITGPLSRGDWGTLERDLAAFEGDAFYDVFADLIQLAREEFGGDKTRATQGELSQQPTDTK